MKKEQNKVRALAKKVYSRAAINDEVCIEAVSELQDVIETGLTDDALALFARWCQMATQYELVSWEELAKTFDKKDLARFGIYLDGTHEVSDDKVIVAGSAIVKAVGHSFIWAFGDSHVNTEDSCFVWAHDKTSVHAHGGIVYAFHHARVKIKRGLVYAFDDSIADPCTRSYVHRPLQRPKSA